MFVLAIVGFHLILKLGIASVAGGPLEAQRRNGGMEMVLCCTPLIVSEILFAQWLAMRRLLLRPALAVVVLDLVMVEEAWRLGGWHNENKDLIYFIGAATAMLLPDMVGLGWLAMWLGMSQPKARGGATGAIILVCGVPWLLIASIVSILSWLQVQDQHLPNPWGLWLIIGLGMDFAICRMARWQLHKKFRRWGVPSHDPAPSLWVLLKRVVSG